MSSYIDCDFLSDAEQPSGRLGAVWADRRGASDRASDHRAALCRAENPCRCKACARGQSDRAADRICESVRAGKAQSGQTKKTRQDVGTSTVAATVPFSKLNGWRSSRTNPDAAGIVDGQEIASGHCAQSIGMCRRIPEAPRAMSATSGECRMPDLPANGAPAL